VAEDDGCCGEPAMKFRLTYEGELRPTQRDPEAQQADPLAAHKQRVRRAFHGQLRQLWSVNRYLSEHRVFPEDYPASRPITYHTAYYGGDHPDKKVPLAEAIARQYSEFGYRFVPLVRESASLLCSLDILFLRRDIPGSLIRAGDIDNRIKTMIDALRRPRSQNELVGDDAKPGPDEDPFFVLLEDDSQVSHLSVETDTLLDPASLDDFDQRKVRLVITVELRPYNVTWGNISFV